MNNETFVILDLETTGLDHERDQIIEIAALKVAYDGATYREIGRFQTLVALEDGRELSDEITRLTGITAQMLDGAPALGLAMMSLRFFAAKSIIVAHNAPFDLAFLDELNFVPHKGFICTRAMAKLLGFPKASLKNVYRTLFGAEIFGHHRAMSDAESTRYVFETLRNMCHTMGIEYRNVVVDSPDRALRFVPSGARVVTMGGEKVA